jgi:spermidine synthase
MVQLLIVGLVSLLGQAILLRELSVAFFGIDLIYTLALGMWLFWTGLGALMGRARREPSPFVTEILFALFSLLLMTSIVFIRMIRPLISDVPGAYLPLAAQIAALACALLPEGLLSGWLFQRSAKSYLAGGKTLAAAYAIESVGGTIGGLCATWFLSIGLQNFTIALICSFLTLIAAWNPKRGFKVAWIIPALAAFPLVMLAWNSTAVDRKLSALTHPQIVDSRDTPYSRITVVRRSGQTAVYENDALSFETEGTEAEEFVHMAALLHPGPTRVLILGGGVSGTLGEMLKHAPEHIDYVEQDPALLAMAEKYLPDKFRLPLRNPTVSIRIADARHFLKNAGQYDLILVGMPEPSSGQTNRFYTREFFQECAGHLRNAGIIAFRLPTAENLWTADQLNRAASIYRSLQAAYSEVLVLPGAESLFAASARPLPRSPELPISRFRERGIEARLVSAPYIRYAFTNDRFARIQELLAGADAPINTDVRPVCYRTTLTIWLSKLNPEAAAWYFAPQSYLDRHGWLPWFAAAAVLAAVVLIRKHSKAGRILLVALAAFCGMTLETLIVLHYQAQSGILFQNIGLLLTGFMSGLALGAGFTDRRAFLHSTSVGYGRILAAGLSMAGLAVAAAIHVGWLSGLALSTGLLALIGFLVGAIFAYASLQEHEQGGPMAAALYAADLIGGCFGSVAATLILIPTAGLVSTAAGVGILGSAGLILIAVGSSRISTTTG